MATVATETTRLIAFMLPSSPYSTQMARFYCRAALRYHGLGEFVDDAEIVISELATNADASPNPPVMRSPSDEFEHWRGLHILSHDKLAAEYGVNRAVVWCVLTALAYEGHDSSDERGRFHVNAGYVSHQLQLMFNKLERVERYTSRILVNQGDNLGDPILRQ